MDTVRKGPNEPTLKGTTRFAYSERQKGEHGHRCPYCGIKLQMSYPLTYHLKTNKYCQQEHVEKFKNVRERN